MMGSEKGRGMPLYELTERGLTRLPAPGFSALGLYERADIQRLLRDDISVLGEDLLVISEEFGEWEDARRRIDLLALDKAGRLVVIEIDEVRGACRSTGATGHGDWAGTRAWRHPGRDVRWRVHGERARGRRTKLDRRRPIET